MRGLIAVLALLLVLPGTALAVPALNGEFDVSGQPLRLTQGPDGNVWVTLANNKLARVQPDGTVTEFDLPAGTAGAEGITAGPDGNLWIEANGEVIRVDPANAAAGQDFAIAGLAAQEIVTGPDGNLWVANVSEVVRVGTAGTEVAPRYTNVTVGARGLVTGRDGNVWIADFGGAAIVKVTPAGTATPYTVGGGPQQVAAGPAGQLAFTNPNSTFGRMAYDGTFQETAMAATDPFGVVFGQDGAWWTAQFASNSLGRVTTDGTYTQLPLTANSGPRYLTTGAGNTLWVALQTTNKIARVTGVDPPPGMDPIPPPPDFAPVLSELRVTPRRARPGRRRTVRFKSSEAATGTIRIRRRVTGTKRFRTVITLTRPVAAGTNAIRFKRRLRRGRYRVVVTARDAASNVSAPVRARFRVTRR